MVKGRTRRTGTLPPLPPPEDESIDTDTGEILSVEKYEADDFAGLWEADADGTLPEVVQLFRIAPQMTLTDPETGAESKLCGYLENLPPSLMEYRSYVKTRYGGGTFRGQRKQRNDRGQLVINKAEDMDIAGPPLLPRPDRREHTPVEVIPGTQPPAPPVPTGAVIKVEGADIPLDADMNDILKWMVKLKAIREAFPEKPDPVDPNATLLQLLLNERHSNQGDPAKLIESIGGIVGAVRDILPEGGGEKAGGDGWLGIAGKALDAFSKLAQTNRGPLPQPGRIPVSGTPAKEIPETTTPTENPESMEAEPMTKLQVAQVAISNINAAFQVTPRKDAARVVQMLDNLLPLSKEQRSKIQPYRQDLFDMAHVAMNDYFADVDGAGSDDFEPYFYQVFDLYVDPTREIRTLEGDL